MKTEELIITIEDTQYLVTVEIGVEDDETKEYSLDIIEVWAYLKNHKDVNRVYTNVTEMLNDFPDMLNILEKECFESINS